MSTQAGRRSMTAKARDTDADERLVREVLAHIAQVSRRALIEGTAEIGDYLILKFFDGNLELATSNSPTKAEALKRLLERAGEIDTSAAYLRRAIRFSVQYRALPASVRDKLSMRQQLALLPVSDPQLKRKLAEEALSRGLTSDQLVRRIRQLGPRKGGSGRQPLPELQRTTSAALRLLDSEAIDGALAPAALRALPDDARDAIRRTLVSLRERMERIADALGRTE